MNIKFNEAELQMLIDGLGFLMVHNSPSIEDLNYIGKMAANYAKMESIKKLKSMLKKELDNYER